jgi:hypothetical protein
MQAVRRRRGGGGVVRTRGRQGWGAADHTGGRQSRWCGTLEPPACIALLHGGAVAPPYTATAHLKTLGAARHPLPPLSWIPSMRPHLLWQPLGCVAALRPLCPRSPLVWEGSIRQLRPLSPLAAGETAMLGISMWTCRSEPTGGGGGWLGAKLY